MGSFNHGRSFTETTWNETVFLPIVASESAPLDRYNLFSLYHIIDFGNMIILWSSASIFILTSLIIGFRKEINWNSTPLLLIGTTLLLQVGFFFLFNPLLSMPNDWDILSIPIVSLLIFILIIIKQLNKTEVSKQIIGTVLALSLFSLSIFVVNNNQSSLSYKLQKQGEWEFQTYWIGSSTSILAGISLEDNLKTRKQRLNATIDDLEKYAIIGNDIEYAELLYQKGKYFFEEQDYKQALHIFNKADSYSTFLCKNHYHQLVCNFMLADYKSAHQHSSKTVICEYPSPIRSYEIALHTSLEAGDLFFADSICNEYLKHWPTNKFIVNVHKRIKNGENPKNMFASNWKSAKKLELSKNNLNTKNSIVIDSLEALAHLKRDSATLGNDQEFLKLLTILGDHYFDKKNYSNCLTFYNEALKYSVDSCEITYQILIAQFMLEQFVEANKYCDQIINCQFPTPQKAYRIAIHTSIEGLYLGQAELYCSKYLEKWPNDDFIKKVHNAIINKINPEQIRGLFKQKQQI
jgi:tetratricopeptide (TPR) repeat protein